jgi:hypothetical protein
LSVRRIGLGCSCLWGRDVRDEGVAAADTL